MWKRRTNKDIHDNKEFDGYIYIYICINTSIRKIIHIYYVNACTSIWLQNTSNEDGRSPRQHIFHEFFPKFPPDPTSSYPV